MCGRYRDVELTESKTLVALDEIILRRVIEFDVTKRDKLLFL